MHIRADNTLGRSSEPVKSRARHTALICTRTINQMSWGKWRRWKWKSQNIEYLFAIRKGSCPHPPWTHSRRPSGTVNEMTSAQCWHFGGVGAVCERSPKTERVAKISRLIRRTIRKGTDLWYDCAIYYPSHPFLYFKLLRACIGRGESPVYRKKKIKT